MYILTLCSGGDKAASLTSILLRDSEMELQEANQIIESLEDQITQKNETIQVLERGRRNSQFESQFSQMTSGKKTEMIRHSESDNEELTNKVNGLREDLIKKEDESEKMRVEMIKLGSTCNALRKRRQALQNQYEAMVEKASADKGRMETTLQSKRSHVNELKRNLGNKEGIIKKLNRDLCAKDLEIVEEREVNELTKKVLQAAQEDLRNMTSIKIALEQKLEDQEDQRRHIQTQQDIGASQDSIHIHLPKWVLFIIIGGTGSFLILVIALFFCYWRRWNRAERNQGVKSMKSFSPEPKLETTPCPPIISMPMDEWKSIKMTQTGPADESDDNNADLFEGHEDTTTHDTIQEHPIMMAI